MTVPPQRWMMQQVMDQPEVLDAVLVSEDGLLAASSPELPKDDAETYAAGVSGVMSTSKALAAFCRADLAYVKQYLVEFDNGFIITIGAGGGAYLAVATSKDADVGQVAYRMNEVVDRLGREMGSEPRQDVGSSA